MQAAISAPSRTPRPSGWRSPRTRSTPAPTRTTPAISPAVAPAIPTTSTRTGASPRATGYTTLSAERPYAYASSAKYASSNAAEPSAQGHTSHSTSHVTAATGANSTTERASTTAVAACTSRARASSRFHPACRNAAASASMSAAELTRARPSPAGHELDRIRALKMPLVACEPVVIRACDVQRLLLRHRARRPAQVHGVDECSVGEPDPVTVEGPLVSGPEFLDVL